MKLGKNSKGTLICLVGIDGAGKSTLAKALISRTKEHGIKYRYVWGGFNSSFMIFRPFIGAMKASIFRGDRYMRESRTKGRVLKSRGLSTVYQYLMLCDYILQASFKLRLPLTFGANVVCDRYIYDLMAAVGVLLDYPPGKTMALLDRCLALLPKPDLVFLIDVPEDSAYQRKDDIISLDFLSVRRRIYLHMAQQHEMTILDGSGDPQSLAQLATEIILQHMARS